MTAEIIEGDCLAVLPTLADASVDAVVTDPPYGLGFMGKEWDKPGSFVERKADKRNNFDHVGGNHNPTCPADAARTRYVEGRKFQAWCDSWARECLRVLKPGGHLLAFGGTRTYHRMACAIEDAGFEIRDSIACLTWVYGSGFPKSLDISKAIDKAAGADRNVVGKGKSGRSSLERVRRVEQGYRPNVTAGTPESYSITIPATDAAKQWSGWGTALKPAHENIILARKPISEGTVAANVLKHGTGGLHVDACRVPIAGPIDPVRGNYAAPGNGLGRSSRVYEGGYTGTYDGPEQPHPDSPRHDARGRFPPNLVLSHHPDCERIGVKRVKARSGTGGRDKRGKTHGFKGARFSTRDDIHPGYATPDGTEVVEAWRCVAGCPIRMLDEQAGERKSGGSNGVRSNGVLKYGGVNGRPSHNSRDIETRDGMEANTGGASRFFPTFAFDAEDFAPFLYCTKASRAERTNGGAVPNSHCCVKPLALMRWLCRLVTPSGGLICDPFAGSGTTGVAAVREGFHFIGIEQSPEYCAIARARLDKAAADRPLLAPA